MSTHGYPIVDYGFILSDKTLKTIEKKIIPDSNKKLYGNQTSDNIIEKLEDAGCEIQTVEMFDGKIYNIATGTTKSDYNNHKCDKLYYITLDKTSSLFNLYYGTLGETPSLSNTGYKDINEIITEIKNKIGKYLTDDFPYKENIKYIVGTGWG